MNQAAEMVLQEQCVVNSRQEHLSTTAMYNVTHVLQTVEVAVLLLAAVHRQDTAAQAVLVHPAVRVHHIQAAHHQAAVAAVVQAVAAVAAVDLAAVVAVDPAVAVAAVVADENRILSELYI